MSTEMSLFPLFFKCLYCIFTDYLHNTFKTGITIDMFSSCCLIHILYSFSTSLTSLRTTL